MINKTLLILCLNEISGLKAIMPQIKKEWYDQLLVIDGGSSDGSIEWCKENGYEVYVQKKRGFRHGYIEAWDLVKGKYVACFSPDGNSIPESIPEMFKKIAEGYDLVIASRYLGNAKSEDDDIITGFGNWLFTKTVNLLYNGNFTDVMVILRVFKKELINDLNLLSEDTYSLPEKLFFTKISWEPIMSCRAAKMKKKITEIPFDEPKRIGGERKLQIIRWGAAYYFQFIRELWFWRKK